MTPGSAIRLTSDARHITDCATGPSIFKKIYRPAHEILVLFVCFDFLCPSEQFFSHVSTGLPEETTK